MSKINSKWINKDVNSLENDGVNLRVRVVTAGAIERTASGLNVKTSGITDSMLAGSISFAKLADANNIARLDQNESIVGLWDFPAGANAPTINSQEISTKEYVDSVAQGLKVKAPCKALSATERDPVTGGLPSSVDGVTSWSAGDRILLIGQTTNPEQNGIWEVQTGAWTRPDDFPTGGSASSSFTFIDQGTNYAESGWVCTTSAGSDIIDTDDLAFVQFSGAGQISAGNGLEKVGNILNVLPAQLVKGGNAEIDGDTLDIDYVPTNYTRTTVGGITTDAEELTSHLKGIDNAIGGIGQTIVEFFSLNATDVSNKYVTLANTPKTANRVVVIVKNAPPQYYGDDYQMDGVTTDRLTWAGLGLDGELSSGDKLAVYYDI